MLYQIDCDEKYIRHDLNPLFPEMISYRTCRQLKSSELFRKNAAALDAIQSGIEWQNHRPPPPEKPNIRIVAWNIERGINLEGIIHILKNDRVLADADVLLLTEVDIGMGRSGNYNIAREIAEALKMNYCFANSFLVLAKGDEGEQMHDVKNTLSLHGTAILTRHKLISCKTVDLPTPNDCFNSLEKQFGNRRGIICKIKIGKKEYDFATCHLDLKTSAENRAAQLESILIALNDSTAKGQIIGGDFNTHTYNLSNKWRLFLSFLYKLFFLGTRKSIAHYMTPDRFFEKPLFRTLQQYGFNYDRYNDSLPTLSYDIFERTLNIKTKKYLPGILFKIVTRILAPWEGKLDMRLDWLAGRRMTVIQADKPPYTSPHVRSLPKWNKMRISDHLPLVADVAIEK